MATDARAEVLLTPQVWEGPETVARVREAARQCLPAGTLYEVVSSFPDDFGREPPVVWCQSGRLVDETLVPFVPGSRFPNLLAGHILYCRERVPDAD